MAVSNQLKNQHIMWRAGFGPMVEDLHRLDDSPPTAFVNALFKASSKPPVYIDVADNFIKGLAMGVDEIGKQSKRDLTPEERKRVREQSKKDIKNLNLTWLNKMIDSKEQLREKMAFFWHGHFASRNLNILYQQQLLDVVRTNALGNFRDLLTGVSKSAAMINFLNNNQNRKDHPNENFAREVMELFTLGRGNYTESDVKEAARAFTGWGAGLNGEFVFRKFQHDDGTKTVLGKTGKLQGEDILDILLNRPETAQFITRKIYRFFVNEQVDENHIRQLSDTFYKSDYDISKLMREIFSSNWFYNESNIGARIKSPIELLAGMQRMLPMELENPEAQLLLQRLLGQLLFYPPNVAGWPGGKNWIDSSSLMLRLRLPKLLYEADELAVSPKDDDDIMMGMKEKNLKQMGKLGGQLIGAQIDWNLYVNKYEKIPREKLMSSIAGNVLQIRSSVADDVIIRHADSSSRNSFIKSATIQLMCTPEYQLC
ncbi:MAG: DUF1800 domain-containing protein [Chitinophagaceae bacterium]|nr:DUF1800 domain-containing protein [Chitinophagaceae bacterium]